MNFINPIELLELQTADASTIDISTIKRAKRKVQAEIDLADDGMFDFKGKKVTLSDCERAIDELALADRKEYYSFIAKNRPLNDYLSQGVESIFTAFPRESIYELRDFVTFISPYFSERFSRSIVNAFKANDIERLSGILRTRILIAQSDTNNAFKGLASEINNRLQDVNSITQEIKAVDSKYTSNSIISILKIIENTFPVELLNALPSSYFQSQINKIASCINSLQYAVDERFDQPIICVHLLQHLLKLNIESIGKQVFEQNYEILKKRHEEKLEQKKHEPILSKWNALSTKIGELGKQIDKLQKNPEKAVTEIDGLFSVPELNSLPPFANGTRIAIAYAIRSISIDCWNKQEDINSALILIRLAQKINVPVEDKEKFNADEHDLIVLEEKYKGILTCHFCDKNKPTDLSKIVKTIYLVTNRSYFGRTRRVQYSTSTVTVPRCESCKEVHSKADSLFYLLFLVCIVIGGIIGAVTEDEHFIIGGLIGGVAGYLFGKIVEYNIFKKHGIKSASNSTLAKHPLLIERTKGGWTFSKPSA